MEDCKYCREDKHVECRENLCETTGENFVVCCCLIDSLDLLNDLEKLQPADHIPHIVADQDMLKSNHGR